MVVDPPTAKIAPPASEPLSRSFAPGHPANGGVAREGAVADDDVRAVAEDGTAESGSAAAGQIAGVAAERAARAGFTEDRATRPGSAPATEVGVAAVPAVVGRIGAGCPAAPAESGAATIAAARGAAPATAAEAAIAPVAGEDDPVGTTTTAAAGTVRHRSRRPTRRRGRRSLRRRRDSRRRSGWSSGPGSRRRVRVPPPPPPSWARLGPPLPRDPAAAPTTERTIAAVSADPAATAAGTRRVGDDRRRCHR